MKKRTIKMVAALASAAMLATSIGVGAFASEGDGSTPRNETLYFGGQQWGAINDWNPMSANSNNAMGIQQKDSTRTLIYETLFMYNLLDNELYPLLGTEWAWDDEATMASMTVKLNPDAHWSDGTALTAADVVATFDYNLKCQSSYGVEMSTFITSMEAVDDQTVKINSVVGDDGVAVNPLMIKQMLQKMYVMQKAYLETVEARCESPEDMKLDKMEDLVASGPYMPYYDDEQKVVFIRDENYWGQAESMWGSLPVPKYIGHVIYKDNAAAQTALEQGEMDVAQLFLTDVQKMWEEKELPITTYIDEPPYNIAGTIPTCWFNVEKPGLDRVEVRKAIAMATDYDQILASAMSNQSPSFADVPRSMMNPSDPEQASFDHDALKDLQWIGKDIEGANALLDEAGIVDTDGDGIREVDGTKLSFKAECPSGWTDWNASLEIVAAAGKEIGIEIETYFPEASVWTDDYTTGNFDILMNSVTGASITNPFYRCKQFLYGPFADLEINYSGNYGHYRNAEADEILDGLATETDPEALKAAYTRLNEIYLTDVPSFGLMYRPDMFYTVNETVWTGYPMNEDGTNIPPTDCTDGYGIAALYQLELVEG